MFVGCCVVLFGVCYVWDVVYCALLAVCCVLCWGVMCLLLVFGRCLLSVVYWSLFAVSCVSCCVVYDGYLLFVVRRLAGWLLVVCNLLFGCCCLLVDGCWLLFVVRCLAVVVRCVLFAAWCLVCVVCCCLLCGT